ncbi:MAG: ATP-binding protein [Nitrospirae bacterium]|nr:MAG: ATP-binding protein [Nitrospirota bacterium]
MDDVLDEIRQLRLALTRIADALAPRADAEVFDRHRSFRALSGGGWLVIKGIASPDPVRFRELKGIDDILISLRQNTEQFIQGLPCNNVLLYGPRGTGKSSAIKALLSEYGRRGLRIIEMPKGSLVHLAELQEMLSPRKEMYILFCDDLSFDADDESYISIKTVLEGGLGARPQNMLIYATSNRRHLMPERFEDNLPVFSEGELQPGETLEEKMSLSDRFGLRLGIGHFDKETYLAIVSNYAQIRGIRLAEEELQARAMQWSVSHGNFSGRTARQFIDDLDGRLKTDKKRKKK